MSAGPISARKHETALASPPPVEGLRETLSQRQAREVMNPGSGSAAQIGPSPQSYGSASAPASIDLHQTNVMAPVEIEPVTPVEWSGEGWTDAQLKDAVSELLSHRGERPYRILRGGQALWETWLPSFRAALRYLPAASPATHAGSVREECAAACDRIANDSVFVGDTQEGRIRHEGIIAGARNCAIAILAALHPVDSRAQGGEAA